MTAWPQHQRSSSPWTNGECLAHLERVLTSRYGADYEVVCERDGTSAGRRLEHLCAQGRMVAVVLADQWLGDRTGIDLLASVRALHPLVKRGLLVSRGDWSVREPMVRAIALGQIDGYLPKPARTPDEQFHRLLTEYLDEWNRTQGPPFVALRLIGEQWHARCAELRDLLGRNAISFEFCSVTSPAARDVLERAGLDGSRLPVVELYTGEVLVDPPNERLAEAFGVTEPPHETAEHWPGGASVSSAAGTRPGQAAVHLAKYAAQVTIHSRSGGDELVDTELPHVAVVGAGPAGLAAAVIIVRSASLAASMSSYLIREIEADPRIEVRYEAELAGGRGEGRLEAVTIVDPRTGWLPPEIERDDWGFLITGADLVRE